MSTSFCESVQFGVVAASQISETMRILALGTNFMKCHSFEDAISCREVHNYKFGDTGTSLHYKKFVNLCSWHGNS